MDRLNMADYDEVFRPPTKFVIVAGAIAAGAADRRYPPAGRSGGNRCGHLAGGGRGVCRR